MPVVKMTTLCSRSWLMYGFCGCMIQNDYLAVCDSTVTAISRICHYKVFDPTEGGHSRGQSR